MPPLPPLRSVPAGAPALLAVGRLNRAVAARARQGHVAQGLCAAIAAGALTVSIAVLGGQGLEDAELYVLALTMALFTFLAWHRATPLSDGTVASRVDDGLGLRGAYMAAFEAGHQEAPSVMSELGAERVVATVRLRAALDVAVPHTVSFVALPLLALAALVVSVGLEESSRGESGGERARSFAISADLSLLARDGAVPMDDAAREAIARAAAAAAAGASSSQRPEEMREVAEELEALALEAPPGSELAEALARAAAAAESVALEAGEDASSLDQDRQASTEGRDPDRQRGTQRETEGTRAEGEGERGEAGGLASGASTDEPGVPGGGEPDGRGGQGAPSTEAGGDGSDREESDAQRATRTTLDGGWWGTSNEGIVSRWVALQRGAPAPASDGQ